MKINSQNKSFSATVHRELLCYYSPYYTAALKGGFAEAQTNTITVDLSDEETADLVSWLYSGQIISSYYSQLFDIYVFADEKKMLALRRSLMSKIVLCCNASHEDSEANEINYFGLDDMLPYIYRLPPSCGLFRYLADFYVHHWILMPCDVRFDKEDPDKRIPREFYWYVIKALAADRNRMITPKASNLLCRCCQHSSCNYHEHVNGDEWGQSVLSTSSHIFIIVLTTICSLRRSLREHSYRYQCTRRIILRLIMVPSRAETRTPRHDDNLLQDNGREPCFVTIFDWFNQRAEKEMGASVIIHD